MPKLWEETIDAHRRAVRDATLDATAALVLQHGVASVTMSQIAHQTGIGRATLYKYFPDVESILIAWHERQVIAHLTELVKVRDRAAGAFAQLEAVLEAFAFIQYDRHNADLAALVHRDAHVGRAKQHLVGFVSELLRAAVSSGAVRSDVPAGELATYCVQALTAASGLRSRAAVRRLVAVTLNGLRPDR